MYVVSVYSKSGEQNLPLSQNFKVLEFACKDGSDTILINPELVAILQAVRNHFKAPVTITSGYRNVCFGSFTIFFF